MNKFFVVIVLIAVISSFLGSYSSHARILSPEESRQFLKRIIHNSTSHSYWGIWKLTNYADDNDSILYEVVYVPRYGFGWINLNDPRHYIIGDGTYRFIYDADRQMISAVYPGFDLPFLPLGEDNIDVLITNYLVNLEDNIALIISRESGQVVKSFEMDDSESLVSQTYYSNDGRVIKQGEYIYRIDHPDDTQIEKIYQVMVQVIQKKNAFPEIRFNRKRMLTPRLLPPGYSLRRSYLIDGEQGKMYQMVYSDGINFFSLFQSLALFPSDLPGLLKRTIIKKDGELTTLIGEKKGHRMFLVGNLSSEVLSEIFDSISADGG